MGRGLELVDLRYPRRDCRGANGWSTSGKLLFGLPFSGRMKTVQGGNTDFLSFSGSLNSSKKKI
jgi:hypothetical protein